MRKDKTSVIQVIQREFVSVRPSNGYPHLGKRGRPMSGRLPGGHGNLQLHFDVFAEMHSGIGDRELFNLFLNAMRDECGRQCIVDQTADMLSLYSNAKQFGARLSEALAGLERMIVRLEEMAALWRCGDGSIEPEVDLVERAIEHANQMMLSFSKMIGDALGDDRLGRKAVRLQGSRDTLMDFDERVLRVRNAFGSAQALH
jgi:hypothetical protein